MSQVPMEQRPVGQAFTQTPSGAAYFQQQYEQAEAAPQTQPQQPSMQVVAPPPSRAGRGAVMPAPRTYAPQAAPQTEQAVSQAEQPAPVIDPQLQQQLAAERQMYAQREQQWQVWAQQQQQQLAAGQKAQEELARLQNREALAQRFANNEAFAGLETVDADDARKIIGMSAEVLQEPLQQTVKQMDELRQQQAQMQQYMAQQTAAIQSQRARDALLSAHPDFFELYDRNPAFRQFLNQRDGLSYQTREQRAIAEYNAGNAPYLIDLINQFKGQSPNVNNIKTVAPVQVANAASSYQQPAAQPRYTLADLNYFMQTGQISPDQYRDELNKLRAAQPV